MGSAEKRKPAWDVGLSESKERVQELQLYRSDGG